MPVIDVHAHCIPADFRTWLEERGADVGVGLQDTTRGRGAIFGDRETAGMPDTATPLDRRLSEMDRMGIDIQVLAGWIDLTGYELEGAKAITYCQAHNDFLAADADTNRDRFLPIGNVPLQDPQAAVAELDRCLSDLNMVGVEIATTVRGSALDQAGLDPFWEAAQDRGAFILLHPMTPLVGVDLGRYFMSNLIGRPAESTITLGGLILSGVFERYPNLKFCTVHGGGFAPFQMGRLDKGAELGFAGEISRAPSDYLKDLYVDTVVHSVVALEYLLKVFGSKKIMLGTDYPFPMGDLDPVEFIRSAESISEDEVQDILGGNAAALLGL